MSDAVSVARATGRRLKRLDANRGWMRRLLMTTEWVFVVFALLFLGAYAWPILDPQLASFWKHVCGLVETVTYLLFVAEYVARLWSAKERRRYFMRHLPDLAIVALPMLRPLRVLRLLRLLVLFRVLNRKAANALQGRVPLYVSISAATLVVCGALAVLDAERGQPGSNIETFGQALWWAVVTVTTVGYGDHFPVTTTGRFVAVGLMIGGVALIGVVTASFAAWFIDRVQDQDEAEQAATRRDIHRTQRDLAAIMERLDTLTAEVNQLRAEARERDRRAATR